MIETASILSISHAFTIAGRTGSLPLFTASAVCHDLLVIDRHEHFNSSVKIFFAPAQATISPPQQNTVVDLTATWPHRLHHQLYIIVCIYRSLQHSSSRNSSTQTQVTAEAGRPQHKRSTHGQGIFEHTGL